jgi:hypothetical protein
VSSRRTTVLAAILLWRCGALIDVPDKPELAAAEHRMHATRAPERPRVPSSLAPATSVDEVMPPVQPGIAAAADDVDDVDDGQGSPAPSANAGLPSTDGGILAQPPEPLPPVLADAGTGA